MSEEGLVEVVDYKGYKIKIFQDDSPSDPREWSNLGTMICSHERYKLGDEQFNPDEFDGWGHLQRCLKEIKGAVIILPLWLYDHSGISMKTYPHGQYQNWDGGKVGYIYCTAKDIRENFGVEEKCYISDKQMKRAEEILVNEVATYNEYLTGDVYGYKIIKEEKCKCCGHISEEEIDSNWDIFQDLPDIIEDCKSQIDNYTE